MHNWWEGIEKMYVPTVSFWKSQINFYMPMWEVTWLGENPPMHNFDLHTNCFIFFVDSFLKSGATYKQALAICKESHGSLLRIEQLKFIDQHIVKTLAKFPIFRLDAKKGICPVFTFINLAIFPKCTYTYLVYLFQILMVTGKTATHNL